MGRRSIHTAEELRELIISAATEILLVDGIAGLSAREVARRISYSPGTIYNVFHNLDDLVLTIEARMLDRLAERLDQAASAGPANEALHRIAETYTVFTHEQPRMWNLLFEHHMPKQTDIPEWYKSKLDGLMARLEAALARSCDGAAPDEELRRAARILWAGVHGITSLSTADKLANVTSESAPPMVRELVDIFIDGIRARHATPPLA